MYLLDKLCNCGAYTEDTLRGLTYRPSRKTKMSCLALIQVESVPTVTPSC